MDAGNAPWHSKDKNTNAWLMFAFAQPTKLDGFRTKAPSGWDGSSFKDYRFEESNDGKHWNIIKSGQGKNQDCKNTDCDWQEIRWPSTTAKYFRLFMVNNWGCVIHVSVAPVRATVHSMCMRYSRCITPTNRRRRTHTTNKHSYPRIPARRAPHIPTAQTSLCAHS